MIVRRVDTAVILAAGNGRRLHDDEIPPSKPLTRVAGVPLIIRALLSLKREGVDRVVIVTGFRGDEVQATVSADPRVADMDLVFARNEDWAKSNGVSVLTARPHVDGEFLLLMSDHVFERKLLQAILSEDARPDAGGAVLATDRKISQVFDLPDATLVKTDGRGHMVDIGKEITDYDTVDTGVFRCTDGLFEALETAYAARGDCSLSDGVNQLAAAKLMRVADVGDAWWQDVDTPGALAHAEQLLFDACRKPVDGIVSRNLNRHISLFVSKRLKDVAVTPNQVSVVNFGLGVIAALAVTQGTYLWFLVGALFYKLNSIFDGVDGELARVRFQGSVLGEWVDTVADDLSNLLFFAGLTVGAATLPGGGHFVVAGVIACVGQIVTSFFSYRELIGMGRGDLLALSWDFDENPSSSLASKVLSKLRYVVKQDFFVLAFLVMAVFGVLPWALWFAAVGGVAAAAAGAFRNLRASAASERPSAA